MYILDKEGKIIAQDLRGEELSRKMDELFFHTMKKHGEIIETVLLSQ